MRVLFFLTFILIITLIYKVYKKDKLQESMCGGYDLTFTEFEDLWNNRTNDELKDIYNIRSYKNMRKDCIISGGYCFKLYDDGTIEKKCDKTSLQETQRGDCAGGILFDSKKKCKNNLVYFYDDTVNSCVAKKYKNKSVRKSSDKIFYYTELACNNANTYSES
uniref:Uncharacterized protein n=1 Tax=Florenciella sp. virus SA2 TaxID=3240092 RepID=A0AB39JDH3_9VIRU